MGLRSTRMIVRKSTLTFPGWLATFSRGYRPVSRLLTAKRRAQRGLDSGRASPTIHGPGNVLLNTAYIPIPITFLFQILDQALVRGQGAVRWREKPRLVEKRTHGIHRG